MLHLKWGDLGRLFMSIFVVIHPTIMRSKAGTLDKDVRAELIQEVKKNRWIYLIDVKFDRLELLPQFEGHNKTSLNSLYSKMAGNAKRMFGLKSQREVTVDEVDVWFATRKIQAKSEKQIERQLWIVEVYKKEKEKLTLSQRTTSK